MHDVAVAGIEESYQPLDFGRCLFSESADSLARFLGSPLLGSDTARNLTSDSRWPFCDGLGLHSGCSLDWLFRAIAGVRPAAGG
jgi:hypothetical protein